MEEVRELIQILKDTVDATGLVVSGDMLLDCAIRLYISQNISKERKSNSGRPYNPENANRPASPAQLNYLDKLGYTGNTKGLTSYEASKLISSIKGSDE